MAQRPFRPEQSIAAELATRRRVEPLLERHGFTVTGRRWVEQGIAITQVIEAVRDNAHFRMHVRLYWRRDGRNASENFYSASQLRARLDEGSWEQTLANIAAQHLHEGFTHLLLVQDSTEGFVFAALVPGGEIPGIWQRQRVVSDDIIQRGLAGNLRKNHAANGSSPTLWLQDDRYAATLAVAQVFWEWPGVLNVLALPRVNDLEQNTDTIDGLSLGELGLGRDRGARVTSVRSGYPRNTVVRNIVRARARGRCEREGCAEHRPYPSFLDVHHILGVEVSDRVWTCVALCPNCHREAHFSPERQAINSALTVFASRFRA